MIHFATLFTECHFHFLLALLILRSRAGNYCAGRKNLFRFTHENDDISY